LSPTIVNSNRVTPYRNPISHAVRTGNLVFTAGITPFKGERQIAKGDFPAQMRQVMENIRAVLEDAGTSLDNAVKFNVHLRDMADFTEMNDIYRSYFPGGVYPARTSMQSVLPGADFLVEIDCVAEVPATPPDKNDEARPETA
jgi:2-iminobutanoate/2-iminopropanoate deaminase